jgi:hypothetical protein
VDPRAGLDDVEKRKLLTPALQSTTILSDGFRGLFPRGLKLPVRETDHSPPAIAEVKKMWSYTSIPTYAFTT